MNEKRTLSLGGTPRTRGASAQAGGDVRLTLEQQRAQFAWACVQGCSGEYTNLVKAAPALIVNNGLMQALAFWQGKGKGKEHHGALVKHLLGWLHARGLIEHASYAEAMPALYGMPSDAFRRATDEALALLRWLRQFAAACTPER